MMPSCELDWLLDGVEMGLVRFDGEGYGVHHNLALTWIWPWLGELAQPFHYQQLLSELARQKVGTAADLQQVQEALACLPEAGFALHPGLADGSWQEWQMRPCVGGGFWWRVRCEDMHRATWEHRSERGEGDRPLAEQKVLNSLAQTQELTALKSRIITMISHEFRTPLTQIQSSMELLRYFSLTAGEQEELFEQIQQAIGTITEMMDDVLQFRRAEAHRIHPDPIPVDVVTTCQNCIMAMEQGSDRTIDFRAFPPFPPNPLTLDAEILRQILHHLLSNAIKYSPAKSPIQVELGWRGDRLILHVRDWGIGILEQDRPRLLEFFYRGGNIGTIPGTGLGLAILHHYLEILQGDITFDSDPEAGTRFTVSFPIRHE